VQVIEQQGDRALAAQELQERTHGAVIAEPLRRAGCRCRKRLSVRGRGRRQDGRQIRADGLHAPRVERRDVVVERIDGEPERDRALVFGRPALQHEHPCGRGALAHRRHQGALADAGLTEHAERAACSGGRLLDGVVRGGELPRASEQLHRVRAYRRSGGFFAPRSVRSRT
jgi:hypothetical protein